MRDASGTRLTMDLAWTSKKVIPRKPGVSNVRATAPRSMSGRATSRRAAGNRVSPPTASGSSTAWSSSRRLSQRITFRIERFFDHNNLDTLPLVTNIYLQGCPERGRARRKNDTSTKPERLDKDRLLRDSERVLAPACEAEVADGAVAR